MTTPLVSVIIPAYNCASSIRKAVESVLTQTHQILDVIVVDDGSTDGTPDLLATLGNGIRWVRQANRGPGAARNSGLGLARGEYVMFLDADDWILSDKLTKQVRLLAESPSVDWVYCDVAYVDEGGRQVCLASEA